MELGHPDWTLYEASSDDEPNGPAKSLERAESRPASSDARPPAVLDTEVFGLLENRRRRYLLYCLEHHDGEVALSRAVDVVTAWETKRPVEEVRSTDRRCVYATLRRRHSPRLETENVVSLDEDAGTLSFDLDAEKATRWLSPDEGVRWSKYYLGVAAVSRLFVLADVVTEIPWSSEETTHLAVSMLFLGLTVLAVYDHRR